MFAIAENSVAPSFSWNEADSRSDTVRTLPVVRQRFIVRPIENSWKDALQKRIDQIAHLQDDWDGYGSEQIPNHTIAFAVQILEQIFDSKIPAPNFVPVSGGGVQIEWHHGERDLELRVMAPNNAYGWYGDGNDIDESADFSTDFSKMHKWMRQMFDDKSSTKR